MIPFGHTGRCGGEGSRPRSWLRRLWDALAPRVRYLFDNRYARRHDAGKKAAVTRKARKSMAVKGEPTWRIGGLPDLGDELAAASDPRLNDVKVRFEASAPEDARSADDPLTGGAASQPITKPVRSSPPTKRR